MSYITEEEQREHEKETKRRLCRQQIIEHVKKPLLFTPFDCKWIPFSPHLLVLGQYPNNNGSLNIYELSRGELVLQQEKRTAMPFKCGTFGHSCTFSGECGEGGFNNRLSTVRQLATGDFSGSVHFWDLELLLSNSKSDLGTTCKGKDNGAPHAADFDFVGGVTSGSGFSLQPSKRSLERPVTEISQAHSSIINSIDGAFYSGPPEIVTGSRDGCVRVWDTRVAQQGFKSMNEDEISAAIACMRKPVLSLNPVDPQRARDCWSVKFGNCISSYDRVIAAAYDNGDVKLFDMRKNVMIQEFSVTNGVCGLEFDRPDIPMNKLGIATLEGRCRFYDLRTLHPKLGYAYVEARITSGTNWCATAFPSNRELMMFGGAGELVLTQYEYPTDRRILDVGDAGGINTMLGKNKAAKMGASVAEGKENRSVGEEGVYKGVPGVINELNKVKVGDQPINSVAINMSKEGLVACTSFDQTVRVMLVTKLSLL